MATETSLPSYPSKGQVYSSPSAIDSTVLTTIYKFPTMEPLRWETYGSKQLHLPLRKDILHRAIIYEGDATRQGTGSAKTRYEVHGSHRKIRPQKGTGKARLGTRQSPMLRGGGKSFGPHARDFSTDLPKKMYDLAWRTALSWRYRRGELIVCEDGMEIEYDEPLFLKQIYERNQWGKEHGRTLVVTGEKGERGENGNLWGAMESAKIGKLLTWEEVDVKDLLEMGRVVIEKKALDQILEEHQSDLTSKVRSSAVDI